MKIFRVIIICFLIALIMFVIPVRSFACSCAELPTVDEEFAKSAAVFRGEVVGIKKVENSKKVLFAIKETWKGVDQSQIIIQTGLGGGDCGIDFVQGQEYLVYANNSPMYGGNYYSTGICDRTAAVQAIDEDFDFLGQGMAPVENIDLGKELNHVFPTWVVMGFWAIIGAIGVSIIWALWRAKKKHS